MITCMFMIILLSSGMKWIDYCYLLLKYCFVKAIFFKAFRSFIVAKHDLLISLRYVAKCWH